MSQNAEFSPPLLSTDVEITFKTGFTATVDFGTIPKGATVRRVYVVCDEAFDAGSSGITGLFLQMGTDADGDIYLTAADVSGLAVGDISQLGGAGTGYTGLVVETAARTARLQVQALGGQLQDADAGAYRAFIQYDEGPAR